MTSEAEKTTKRYYSPKAIDKKQATYNIIFGERSNGKTYAMLKRGLETYWETGGQLAYVRRWKEDITGRRAQRLYSGINENREVERITGGEFTGVHYYAGRFFLCNYDDKGKPIYSDGDIIAFTFALSDGEHDKSTSFPNVQLIVFDEFLTNRLYLNDEFVSFMNAVSTIVRKRTDVKIYMLGNTVNKYCPYFKEMGLNHILKMTQGTIDLYRYGDSPLTVAVEYCKSLAQGSRSSNKYFAFNNPKLEMITGGAWEMNIYPHLPHKYKPRDVLLTYFIEFSEDVFQAEVIDVAGDLFTFIHAKTTPIKSDDDLVYSLEPSSLPNHNRNIFRPANKVQERVTWFYKHGKVFYQNNEIGDAVNNYLKICRSGNVGY